MDSDKAGVDHRTPFGNMQMDMSGNLDGLVGVAKGDPSRFGSDKQSFVYPVNIDIIITPCENNIEAEYEQAELMTKLCGTQRKKARSRRMKRTVNWLCSYVDERRLRSAATNKDSIEARRLLNKNADIDINAGDERQRTALHISAANGAEDVVRLLLENDASPNVKDVNGNTPLHLAACSGMIPIVTLLLHYGGDISATDSNGKTPLHLVLARQKLFQKSPKKDSTSRYDYQKRRAHLKDVVDLLKECLLKQGSIKEKEDILMLSGKISNLASDKEVYLNPSMYSMTAAPAEIAFCCMIMKMLTYVMRISIISFL